MRKHLATAKNFVARHKTAIAVVGTAATSTYLHTKVIKTHNDFLKEKDLFDEFYNMNETD